MRWYRLDNIEYLPASVSDLVDEDYLCPVVIYLKKRVMEDGWGPKEKDETYNDVFINYDCDGVSQKYKRRYSCYSFYIIVDEEQINEDVSKRAITRLNEVLEQRGEDFRFEYDSNMIKEDS